MIDATFDEPGTPMMVPPPGPERERASRLLGLERELFGAWCQLTFQPGKGMMNSNEEDACAIRCNRDAIGAAYAGRTAVFDAMRQLRV